MRWGSLLCLNPKNLKTVKFESVAKKEYIHTEECYGGSCAVCNTNISLKTLWSLGLLTKRIIINYLLANCLIFHI